MVELHLPSRGLAAFLGATQCHRTLFGGGAEETAAVCSSSALRATTLWALPTFITANPRTSHCVHMDSVPSLLRHQHTVLVHDGNICLRPVSKIGHRELVVSEKWRSGEEVPTGLLAQNTLGRTCCNWRAARTVNTGGIRTSPPQAGVCNEKGVNPAELGSSHGRAARRAHISHAGGTLINVVFEAMGSSVHVRRPWTYDALHMCPHSIWLENCSSSSRESTISLQSGIRVTFD